MLESKIFSAKSYPENAGNRICVNLDFKIFEGEHVPGPPPPLVTLAPSSLDFRSPPPEKTTSLATPLFFYCFYELADESDMK